MKVTAHEMDRRRKMAAAKCGITDSMANHELTAMEWVSVLQECTQRMISHGLKEQWEEEEAVR